MYLLDEIVHFSNAVHTETGWQAACPRRARLAVHRLRGQLIVNKEELSDHDPAWQLYSLLSLDKVCPAANWLQCCLEDRC